MSNFMKILFCKKCYQVTNHYFMDDTPKDHLYTVECAKCGHRPMQGVEYNAMWEDVATDENLIKGVNEDDD